MFEKKKRGGGNLFKNVFGAVLFLGAMAGFCFAKDELTIKYPTGNQAQRDVFFDEKNIVPGWEKSVVFRAENEDKTEAADFFITFDVGGDKDLAEMLKLYVIRVSDGKYQIGGPGERMNLKKADEKKLFIDQISPGKGKNYKIRIVFDENAGNEYQGKKVKFDVDFRLEAEAAGTGNQNQPEESGGFLTGQSQTAVSQSAQASSHQEGEGVEVGKKAAVGEEGEVAGTSTCQGFPLWVWVLGFVIFAFIFWWDRSDKFKKEEEGWGFAIFLLISSLILWKIFDYCQEYKWFPWANLAALLLLALYFNRKKRVREIIRGNF